MRSEMSFDPPIAEIAELAERMRQPGHRRSRQASTRGKLGISERGCTGFEGFEHHQPLASVVAKPASPALSASVSAVGDAKVGLCRAAGGMLRQ
jgi:hypothetical protein